MSGTCRQDTQKENHLSEPDISSSAKEGTYGKDDWDKTCLRATLP